MQLLVTVFKLGSYVKIGALVTLWYNITLSSISTSANSVFISGLPFSTYSISDLYAGGALGAYANINLGTGTTLAYQLPAASGTQIELKEIGDNMGENGVVASELTSTTFIRGSIFYRPHKVTYYSGFCNGKEKQNGTNRKYSRR